MAEQGRRILMVCLGVLAVAGCPAQADLITGEVIVSDFFSGLRRADPGAAPDVFAPSGFAPRQFVIVDAQTVLVQRNFDIYEVNLTTDTSTLWTTTSTAYSDMALDSAGNLVVVSAANGIQRFDAATQTLSTLYRPTFFNSDSLAVSQQGDIYVTEFFDGLGRLDTAGNWTRLGNWSTDFFQALDLGPDGMLYAATTFEGGDIYRIDPLNGSGVRIADDVFSSLGDLAVADDGMIYLAGRADVDVMTGIEDVVLRIDPLTGAASNVVNSTQLTGVQGFLDIQIAGVGVRSAAIPEPSSIALLSVLGGAAGLYRRRKRRGGTDE